MKTTTRLGLWLLLAVLIGLLGCGGAAGQGEVDDSPAPEPTPAEIADARVPSGPPQVENDPPAGICEDTANILSRVDRAPRAMFRALAVDNRVGQNDGDGILAVRFAVVGNGLEYVIQEEEAPYCILGGNEPECGDWPRNEAGRYLWGAGGPVVEPGRYDVFVEVIGGAPDSLSGSDRCNWTFAIQIE
jgi:hypothetical protein